jgi:D-xylose reductase
VLAALAIATTSLLDLPEIQTIAKAHGKTTAQVCAWCMCVCADGTQVLLRFGVQRGISVIPKSSNRDRIASNLDIDSFELTSQEMEAMMGMCVVLVPPCH